ncbi:MAG: glycosyltransferase [Bacilli bacterium]|nr:glycosyltransferase [Bacilli bacterium]
MSKPLISVIVPIYNVEEYLNKCVDSIIGQTYKNLEIILVDDGSPDNCPELCDEYLKIDKRVKVIHKKNGGLSDARNEGVRISTGEYISFIDSDDYVPNNFIEELFNGYIKEDADISICDIKVIYDDKEIVEESMKGDEINQLNAINTPFAASACNKLFKSEIIKKCPFEVGKINEDIAVVIPIIANSKKIAYVTSTTYNYVQRDTSIQGVSFTDKRYDVFDGVDLALSRISNPGDYKDTIVFNQLISVLLYVVPYVNNKKDRLSIIAKFGNLLKKYNISNNCYLSNFINSCKLHNKLFYKCFFYAFKKEKYNKCNMLLSLINRKVSR